MRKTTALVTGGAGGLGLALARALAAAGHRPVLMDLDPARLEAARERLGLEVGLAAADVTDRASVEAALAGLAEPPGIVVNGAGIAASSPLLPPDDALFERTLAVNVTGAWIVSTACLPGMLAAGAGRIVNVASTAGLEAFRYVTAYVASKHALVGLTRAMALDLGGKGVTVNAVCPGFLDTPMTDRTVANIVAATGRSEAEARASIAKMNASGRLIRPDEVAEAVLRLVDDEAANGTCVRIE